MPASTTTSPSSFDLGGILSALGIPLSLFTGGGLWGALGAGSAFLQNLRAQELNAQFNQRRDEALSRFDQIYSPEDLQLMRAGGPTSYQLFNGKPISGGPYTGGPIENIYNPFDANVTYDPTAIDDLISQARKEETSALNESRRRFDDQLTRTQGLYDTGRRDIAQTFGAERGRLLGNRLELGSTFDLLDLPDPEAIYRASLDAGTRDALQAEQATVGQTGSEMFRESARMGRDPFEAGIPTAAREAARSRRLSDIGGAKLGAEGQRLSALASNASTRQAAVASEMQQNAAIDQAIATLTGQEAGEYGDLTTEQANSELAVQSALENALAGTRGIYAPQITNMGISREQNISAGLDRALAQDTAEGDYLNNVLNRQSNERIAGQTLAGMLEQLRSSIQMGLDPANVDWISTLASMANLTNQNAVDPQSGFGFSA